MLSLHLFGTEVHMKQPNLEAGWRDTCVIQFCENRLRHLEKHSVRLFSDVSLVHLPVPFSELFSSMFSVYLHLRRHFS